MPAPPDEGFAVVASEVKSLAEATRQATHLIGDTVRDLDGQVGSLIGESGDASLRAKSAGEGAEQIQSIIERVQSGFTAVGQEIDGVAKAATSNLAHCDMVIDELGNLGKGVDLSSTELKAADDRVARLLDLSEALIELIADSGVETSDAPLIRVVVDTASRIAAAFESAVERGDISIEQLMDENYREIPGTNPKQYLTDYVAFTDRILPPIQDPIQKIDPRIVFCVAWAKGGYLPTHNPNYRLPQGPDPVWNNANCRNRRLFNDRAVRKVAASTKAVPAADLPARHGRRQFRPDEGPLGADPRSRPPLGRLPDGLSAVLRAWLAVMPGLVPGIHASLPQPQKDVDGRDSPAMTDAMPRGPASRGQFTKIPAASARACRRCAPARSAARARSNRRSRSPRRSGSPCPPPARTGPMECRT